MQSFVRLESLLLLNTSGLASKRPKPLVDTARCNKNGEELRPFYLRCPQSFFTSDVQLRGKGVSVKQTNIIAQAQRCRAVQSLILKSLS